MSLKQSELILNQDGSIYHLNLKPEQLKSRQEAAEQLALWIEDAAVRQFILKICTYTKLPENILGV